MTRFFVSPEELQPAFLTLTGENAAHAKVLRLKCGESVLVCDGQGRECLCTVSDISPGRIGLAVRARQMSDAETCVRISVYMAYPKAEKLEHVIQKATELGAAEIVAFPSRRCVSRPDGKDLPKKCERWRRIAASAAEQSGRGRIPEIVALASFDAAIARAAQSDLALLFYENERAQTLKAALEGGAFASVSLMTGPEGGLEVAEVRQAQDAGLVVCSLGKRILRCETAPLCALSAVLYAAGEL